MLAESQECDPEYQLPDLHGAELLTELLAEIGEGTAGDKGLIPVGWQEIDAWARVTGSVISPGEAGAIKYLSTCYVAQYYRSIDPGCLSPNVEILPGREEVENKMKSLFALLRSNDG